jgi:DNA-directed RNA polymerase subunit H (RpoH/RPB5)
METHTVNKIIATTMNNAIGMLHYRGYDTSPYASSSPFTMDDIDDMLMDNTVTPLRVVHAEDPQEIAEVYYAFTDRKQTTGQDVVNIKKLHDGEFLQQLLERVRDEWEALGEEGGVLADFCRKRTVIIVSKDIPKPEALQASGAFFRENGIYVQLFYYKHLMFNIIEHKYVPKHIKISSKQEKERIRRVFNVENDREFPVILHTDPVALYIGLRPHDICKIIRVNEKLAGCAMYRFCR